MRTLYVVFLFSMVFFVSSCSTKYELFQQKESVQTTQKQEKKEAVQEVQRKPIRVVVEYKISPGDRVSVIVFRHPELSTRRLDSYFQQDPGILVSKKGYIVLPLIGEIKVSGLTEKEASEVLRRAYAKYIRNPNVYVEILNKRVYVIGEVNKPGPVQFFDDRITLIEAIARAGDFNVYAKRDRVLIIRGDLSNPSIIPVDLTNLNSIRTTDLFLQPDDIVYVPPNRMRKVNVVINEVSPPIRFISEILQPFVQIKFLSQ